MTTQKEQTGFSTVDDRTHLDMTKINNDINQDINRVSSHFNLEDLDFNDISK